jgi:hypothetical protein
MVDLYDLGQMRGLILDNREGAFPVFDAAIGPVFCFESIQPEFEIRIENRYDLSFRDVDIGSEAAESTDDPTCEDDQKTEMYDIGSEKTQHSFSRQQTDSALLFLFFYPVMCGTKHPLQYLFAFFQIPIHFELIVDLSREKGFGVDLQVGRDSSPHLGRKTNESADQDI